MHNIFNNNIGNLISDVFEISYIKNSFLFYYKIFVEGLCITLISLYICSFINIYNPGILSIFFIASALVSRLSQILENNRENIITLKKNVFLANKDSIIIIIFIFGGIFIGYTLASILISNIIINYFNGFINIPQKIDIQDLFISFSIIFSNNVDVAILSFLLSFVYRSFGMMLTIVWNACIWGVTFSLIFIKNYNILLSLVVIIPHLVMEVVSYITVSLSAIFLSKAIILYKFSDRIFINIVKTVLVMLLASVIFLYISSLIEVYYTQLILTYFD